MKKNFNLKRCLALLLVFAMVATNLGNYISAKAETTERYVFEPDKLNTDGGTYRGTSEVTTLQGVDVLKFTPDGTTADKDVIRDRWNMSGLNISASNYKYVAVDYYYDSEEVTGGSWTGWKIGNDMVGNREMSDLYEETMGPAIVDYDTELAGDCNPPYMAKLIAQGWKDIWQNYTDFTPGKTYVFTCDYYIPEGSEGSIRFRAGDESTGGTKAEKTLSGGTSGTATLEYTVPENYTWFGPCLVQNGNAGAGEGYYWNLCMTEKGSDVNLIKNADFTEGDGSWIGWNIGGADVLDKATSDSWAERAVVIPFDTAIGGDLNPKYMAKLTGNYTNPSGQAKTWVNTWQDIYSRIEAGNTYVFSCDYYMPANATGSIRLRGGDASQTMFKETILNGGTTGVRGTATVELEVTQENKDAITWFGPCIVQYDGGGVGYYWNPSVKVKGSDTNLLQNADFTEGDVDHTGETPEYMAIKLNDNATSANWSNLKNSENTIVKNQWARVIFDVSDFNQTGNYAQMYLYPWGSSNNSKGSTAVGTMYINNLSFYTSNPGQPSVTSISFDEGSFTYPPGTSHEIPVVTVTGENYPIEAYDLELSGQKSDNTRIGEDGKLYIGADETSETLTITAKSVLDASQTATCTIHVQQTATRVTVDLKNAEGYNVGDGASAEDTIYGGVESIKITPKATSSSNIRFNYWDLQKYNLSAKEYQYAAVDYYYDVGDNTDGLATEMKLWFHYSGQYIKVPSTTIVTNQWARVIFDFTGYDLSGFYQNVDGEYDYIFFFLYGDEGNYQGNTAVGTMYINNVSFYTSEIGQPAVTGISFAENELTCVPGTSREIPTVTVTGNNYPIEAYDLEVSGQKSDNTKIGEDGKLHIGADETSETLTITAKSVIDESKTATCTVHAGQTAERVTVSLKNADGYDINDMTVVENETYEGVSALKVTPAADAMGNVSRFNYYDIKNESLKVATYQYVAVDYYYDVSGVTDSGMVANDMKIMFVDYANSPQETYTVQGTEAIVTGQWARVIFDLTGETNQQLVSMYADRNNDYYHIYFYPYGNSSSQAVAGTMYINNVSFYTSEIGQPAVTGISFSKDNLKGVPDSSVTIPNVTVEGNNYPITDCNIEVTGQTSSDTEIRNGKLYIGANEESETLTITASAVVNPQKTETCTVAVVESTLPSGDPEYMAKMIGTYITADGVTKQWKEVWQTFSEIEIGETYEFSFNYFVQGGGVQARIMGEGWKVLGKAFSKAGEVGTMKATYTAKEGDTWLAPLISKDTEGIAYVWNLCFKKADVNANLLENADFTEGDGSWIGWNIASEVQKDKAGSDAATATVGHAIIPFDTNLFLYANATGATLSTTDETIKMEFDFTTLAQELSAREETVTKYGAVLYSGTTTWNAMISAADGILASGSTEGYTSYVYTERENAPLPDKYHVKILNSNNDGNGTDNRGRRTTAIAYVITESGRIYYSDRTINHSVMSVLKAIFNETYLTDEANVKDGALVAESLLAKALEQSKVTYSDLTTALTAAPTSAKQRTLLFDVHYALNNYAFVLADSATMQLNAKSGGADAASAILRKAILDTTDAVIANTGTTYYISSLDGNDSNGGTSETSAVATYSAVQSKLTAGDKVLFERGGVYRGSMNLVSGVTYAAYGEGDKPAIYGSPQNYDDCWEATATDNVWKCTEAVTTDIGTIVFDHGWAAGRRMFVGTEELAKNFDFYQNLTTGEVYLYLDCNPSEVFSDIEFCVKGDIMKGEENTSNVTIDNLSIKYGGSHGIAFLDYSSNIKVTNCEIAWIGGSLLQGNGTDLGAENSTSERYGNGVEFWRNSSNITVENNWIYQIYDAGITNQSKTVYREIFGIQFGEKSVTQSNITYKGNLIEYCTYGIEYFQGSSSETWKDIYYTENIIRFSGFGWGQVRPNDFAMSAICGWGDTSDTETVQFNATGFNITGNTFDSSKRMTILHYYTQTEPNVTFSGNDYYAIKTYQSEFAYWIGPEYLNAWDTDSLIACVETVEGENPTGTIQFLQ